METMTNEEYRERDACTPLGRGIYSLLTREELKELRHAIECAYPHYSSQDRKRTYNNMACQPVAAAAFVGRVNRAIKSMEAR